MALQGTAPRRDGATKGEQTRQAILEAAIARFGREGFRTTSVADIARDASVGGSLVYAYFPNKEALFLAAVDDDAAAVIRDGVESLIGEGDINEWRRKLVFILLASLEAHPLAKRLLAGLEPEVTIRVLETPALSELRKACAERLRFEQSRGTVRSDIDAGVIANGLVAITLSLLMAVVQIGVRAAEMYADDVAAVLQAAIELPLSRTSV
jgi:AcrR family transcriptional regulator